jgi:drug/metabolite transporter (DMT)-like permease
MSAALLAAIAGASFGTLAVAVRWGLRHDVDPEVGALVTAALGAIVSVILAAPSVAAHGVDRNALVPFFAAGVIAPGASQIVLTFAVAHAGPSRAAILMGTAPLISILLALTLLDEPFRLMLVGGTLLIVSGTVALTGEQRRPEHFRARGAALALLCAALFASRDNLVRWAARDEHPPPSVAAAASLLAATALILSYLALVRGDRLRPQLTRALPAFAPAALALALGYVTLLAAFDRGRVSIVSPLNATGSLWAVLLSALVIGRSELIGRRIILAAFLIVTGAAVIGASR